MSTTFNVEMGEFNKINWREVAAEFFGTLILVFSICAAVLQVDAGKSTLLNVAFAHWLALSAVVFMFGDISGGHANPAVSLSFMVHGVLDILSGIFFIIA